MYCPFGCKVKTKVIDSRESGKGTNVRRRRKCPKCKKRFSTKEIIDKV
jgi:transcriptional repressor NrdR